jgi:hypothetical protein
MTGTLRALFAVALLGTLTVVGLALSRLGWFVLGPYLALVGLGLAVLVRKVRSLAAQAKAKAHGRTCSCCTSTVFDPVEVR